MAPVLISERYARTTSSAQRGGKATGVYRHHNESILTAKDTLSALPESSEPYSEYDINILAEIITHAEAMAQHQARKHKGTGEINLQGLLMSYEAVLPKYQVNPKEDIFYYRFLLKLSLDSNPNWWAKFHQECLKYRPKGAGLKLPDDFGRISSKFRDTDANHDANHDANLKSRNPQRKSTGGINHTQIPPSAFPSSSYRQPNQRTSLEDTRPSIRQPPPSLSQIWEAEPQTRMRRTSLEDIRPFSKSRPSSPIGGVVSGLYPDGTYHPSSPLSPFYHQRPPLNYFSSARPTQDNDDESFAGGSDHEAYADFQLQARSFRTWRGHARIIKESRQAMEAAVENWGLALIFWEAHALGRLFRSWASHKRRVLGRCIEMWSAGSLASSFKKWRKIARYLKMASLASDEHLSFVIKRKFFIAWLKSTKESLAAALLAEDHFVSHCRSKVLRLWLNEAKKIGSLRAIEDFIRSTLEHRLASRTLSAWSQALRGTKRHLVLLNKAVQSFRSSLLRRSCNTWRTFIEERHHEKQVQARAISHWINRSTSTALESWKSLVDHAKGYEEVAQSFFESKVAARVKKDCLSSWKDWSEERVIKSQNLDDCKDQLRSKKTHRLLTAWRGEAKRRGEELKAFDAIAKKEAVRIRSMAAARVKDAAAAITRVREAAGALADNCASRVLRHWHAIAQMKALRGARRNAALQAAEEARLKRCFTALRLISAIQAQHRVMVHENRLRLAVGMRRRCLLALRAYSQVRKHKRDLKLTAMIHWARSLRAVTFRALQAHAKHCLYKKGRLDRAVRHHRTRMLQGAITTLIYHLQLADAKLERALVYRAGREDMIIVSCIHAWKAVARIKAIKHDKERQALAFWMKRRLSTGIFALQAYHNIALIKRAKMRAASALAARTLAAKAFSFWRDHSLYQSNLERKARAYLALLLGRAATKAFFALRANAARKLKSRVARAYAAQRHIRKAMGAWHFRVALGAELETRLHGVFRSMLGETKRNCFNAWVDYVLSHNTKRDKIKKAVQRWRQGALRVAFDILRRHHILQRIGKALASKYRSGLLSLTLHSWSVVAKRRKECKLKVASLVFRTDKKRIVDAFDSWVEFVGSKRVDRVMNVRAVGHLLNVMLGKAFNTWSFAVEEKRDDEAKERAASSHFMQTTGRRMFISWRHGLKVQRAIDLWTGNVLSLSFRHWQSHCNRKLRLRKTMEAVAKKWSRLTLNTAWNTWRATISDWVHLKQLVTRSLLHWEKRQLSGAFEGWRAYVQWRVHMKGTALTVVTRISQRVLSMAFNQWLAQIKAKRTAVDKAQELFVRFYSQQASAIFSAWQQYACRMSRLRLILEKILGRYLSNAFKGWRLEVTDRKEREAILVQLEGRPLFEERCVRALSRWVNWPLSLAFDTWRSIVRDKKEALEKAALAVFRYAGGLLRKAFFHWRQEAMEKRGVHDLLSSILTRIQNRDLSRAFNSLKEHWQERVKGTLAHVHYYGGLMDRCWLAWLQAVEDAELYRGDSAKRVLLLTRVLSRLGEYARWKVWGRKVVEEARVKRQARIVASSLAALQDHVRVRAEERRAVAAMQARKVAAVIRSWKFATLAAQAMQRLYLSRGFRSWYLQVLYLQEKREKLLRAGQFFIFGALARCLLAWAEYAEEMKAKRIVFGQKQEALKEALKVGDKNRREREMALVASAFQNWRLRTGIFKKVALRFASIANRTTAFCFRHWHSSVVVSRSHRHIASEHYRMRTLRNFVPAWAKASAESHKAAVEKEELSEDYRYTVLVDKGLQGLKQTSSLGFKRKEALAKVLSTRFDLENEELLVKVYDAWRSFMTSRADLVVMAEMASRSRRKRVLFNVLHVWHSYTCAMKSSPPDPSSPFLYERSPKEDRRLIQRVSASLSFRPPPPPSSAGTSVWGGDPQPMTAEEEMALLTASRSRAFQDLTHNLPDESVSSKISHVSFARPQQPGQQHSIDKFLIQQRQLSGIDASAATDPRGRYPGTSYASQILPVPSFAPSASFSSRRGLVSSGTILNPPPAAPLGFQGFPSDSAPPRGATAIAPSPVPYRLSSMASPSPGLNPTGTGGPGREQEDSDWADHPQSFAPGYGRGGSIPSQSSDGRQGGVKPQLRVVRSSILDNARLRSVERPRRD